jgi:hypothetical protein
MLRNFRAASFVLALLAALQVAAPSRAADDKAPPANQQPKIFRLTVDAGGAQTVYYTVQNGSLRLQTVYRMLAWAENEMTVVEQLQKLKLDYINSEHVRETQYASGGFSGYVGKTPKAARESTLKAGLSQGLANEGTPEAAVQAIQLLERAETDAANELKQLAPKDRNALDETNKKLQDFVAANAPNASLAPPAMLVNP